MKVTHREGGFRICLYTAVCGICCRHTSNGVSDDLADIFNASLPAAVR